MRPLTVVFLLIILLLLVVALLLCFSSFPGLFWWRGHAEKDAVHAFFLRGEVVRIVRKGQKEYELKFPSQNWEAARQACTGTPSDEEVQGVYLVRFSRSKNDRVQGEGRVCSSLPFSSPTAMSDVVWQHCSTEQIRTCMFIFRSRILSLCWIPALTTLDLCSKTLAEDVWSASEALHRKCREAHSSITFTAV